MLASSFSNISSSFAEAVDLVDLGVPFSAAGVFLELYYKYIRKYLKPVNFSECVPILNLNGKRLNKVVITS